MYGKLIVEPLTESDWEELEFIMEFLHLFNVFTQCFETNKYPTLGQRLY